MDDLISREAVINLITDSCYDLSNINATNMLIDKINEIPSVESKIGVWENYHLVYEEKDGYKCYIGTCPNCKGVQEVWNYCGCCGMKLEAPK